MYTVMIRFADMVYLTASHWYYPRNLNSMENSIVHSNFRVYHLNILHKTTVVLLCLVQKQHNGMKGSRWVEKIIDFLLNFNLEGKSLVECAPLMFKTHKWELDILIRVRLAQWASFCYCYVPRSFVHKLYNDHICICYQWKHGAHGYRTVYIELFI